MRRLYHLTAFWLALALAVTAAPPPAKTDRRLIRVPFRLADGDPVTSADLQVKVNGKEAKVSRLLSTNEDLLLLLVLDWSGDLSVVDPARAALIEGVEKLPANVQVGLLRAQDGLRVLLDPGEDRTRLIDAIRGLTVSGRAGLLNAIEPVQTLADTIASKARVRVAILHVSDSNITNYREDYTNPVVNSSDAGDMSRRFPEGLIQEKTKQLLAAVLGSDTSLFLVQLRYPNDRLNNAYQVGQLDLATASGGAAEFCRSLAEIPVAMEQMMKTVLSTQSIDVEWHSGKSRQAEILLEAQGRNLHFRQRRQWKATR